MSRFPELRAAYHRGIDGRTVDAEAALLAAGHGIYEEERQEVYKGV